MIESKLMSALAELVAACERWKVARCACDAMAGVEHRLDCGEAQANFDLSQALAAVHAVEPTR